MPKGRALGLDFFFSHSGHFAEVADVSVDANRRVTVHKVTVAADVGPVINMSGPRLRFRAIIRSCAWLMRRRPSRISSNRNFRRPDWASPLCRRWRRPSAMRSLRSRENEFVPCHCQSRGLVGLSCLVPFRVISCTVYWRQRLGPPIQTNSCNTS